MNGRKSKERRLRKDADAVTRELLETTKLQVPHMKVHIIVFNDWEGVMHTGRVFLSEANAEAEAERLNEQERPDSKTGYSVESVDVEDAE